ncbi:MAG: peptidyl-prolyl cis-trans isomerase B (cyclophilin B) [Cryomorphaceae bacterium]|jgi:cyclophilin family peptidyl-prolyl cis-trans isomerase
MKKSLALFALLGIFAACTESSTPGKTTESAEIQPEELIEEETPEPLLMEYVVIETNKGNISLELDPNKAPITVANFMAYVDAGFYDNTVFHRVIDGFMIQGGGFTTDGGKKETRDPILLESENGLKNDVGTIAMARTNAPNSATAQFFVNLKDNGFLNYAPGNPGYAVFGKVSSGMDVVNEIRQAETAVKQGMSDWPQEEVVITKAYRE